MAVQVSSLHYNDYLFLRLVMSVTNQCFEKCVKVPYVEQRAGTG